MFPNVRCSGRIVDTLDLDQTGARVGVALSTLIAQVPALDVDCYNVSIVSRLEAMIMSSHETRSELLRIDVASGHLTYVCFVLLPKASCRRVSANSFRSRMQSFTSRVVGQETDLRGPRSDDSPRRRYEP